MEIYNITVPIYALSKEEAESAQNALHSFVENYRNKNIAVTGSKIVHALSSLENNGFISIQVENFFRK